MQQVAQAGMGFGRSATPQTYNIEKGTLKDFYGYLPVGHRPMA